MKEYSNKGNNKNKNYYQRLTNFKSEEKSERVHYIIRQAKASIAFNEINPISRSNHNRYL